VSTYAVLRYLYSSNNGLEKNLWFYISDQLSYYLRDIAYLYVGMASLNLLDLPLELFRAILAECMRARTTKRAFRLRLVNRMFRSLLLCCSSQSTPGLFASEVLQVLYDFRLWDDATISFFQTGDVGIEYMVRRLLNPKLPVSAGWAGLRRIAARLAADDDNNRANYEHYLQVLVRKVAIHGGCFVTDFVESCSLDLDDSYYRLGYNEERELLEAAAYTNKLSLLEKLIDDHKMDARPFRYEFITCRAAIQGGHSDALDQLLDKMTTRRRKEVKSDLFREGVSREIPSIFEKCRPNYDPRLLQCIPTLKSYLLDALRTPYRANFEIVKGWIEQMKNPTISVGNLTSILEKACHEGWEDMAQHLISQGARADGDYVHPPYWPLRAACANGHSSIVKTLFDHGARIRGGEIEAAAARRHWDLVRFLAARGADINGAVCAAVKSERKEIVRELIDMGARLEGEVGERALDAAKDDGLESMIEFLEELGATWKVGQAQGDATE
jgi:hypothetical protein